MLPHKRVTRSAKHILAAVVFNESSKATLQETQGTLLPCMGFYYVCFHSAVSMLWLCESLPEEKMTRLRHSQLRSFVETHLCKTRKLERGFLDLYEQLQDLREYANYNFGSKAPKYEYPQMKQVIEDEAKSTLLQNREVLVTEPQARDQLFEVQAGIGDDIGDDLIKLHSGPLVVKQVWDYLLRSSLTT
ncbi:MAG: hypothetical protein NTW51_04685 [Cyanobacteria bacterium]|nr:hypothetical protein [Cyanobacteriota bacterium]